MTVYILRPDETVSSINRHLAMVGFHLRGEEVCCFEMDELDGLPLRSNDIVVGGIGVVRRSLERMGLATPTLESIPQSLFAFAGRKTWRGQLIDARRAVERGEAVFVKPVPEDLKLFTGQPLREFSDLLATSHLPDDTPVDCADLTPFVSEYRVFVVHGDVIGVRHYKGEPLVFPAADVVNAAIEAFQDAPAAYALDVGVTEDDRTLLVEVNDAYATGAYGLSPTRYAVFIEARWNELRRAERG